jgi:hypothetical protein
MHIYATESIPTHRLAGAVVSLQRLSLQALPHPKRWHIFGFEKGLK